VVANYQVKTSVFEGPLDLLLQLVEKRKLFINDISLAHVADDYIAHIRTFEALPVRDTAHFVLVASTLVLIKSRSILPSAGLTTEEEQGIEELEDRLRKYQRVQHIAPSIREIFGLRPIFFRRHVMHRLKPIFTPHPGITASAILSAAHSICENLPKSEKDMEARVHTVVSIEEVIERVTEHVTRNLRSRFSSFIREAQYEDQSIIVGFLAILELHKQGTLSLSQGSLFDDITMESSLPSVTEQEALWMK
jgi:segregation and condensation protein A